MEYFSKGNELGVEQRTLPASTYNVMRTLFHQCEHPCLFIPVRSMQYQAVVDEGEIVFVYAHRRADVEFAWRKFKPQQRDGLDDPVPYEFVYYDRQGLETMQRMQGEFHKFAHQLYERTHQQNDALDDASDDKNIVQLKPSSK